MKIDIPLFQGGIAIGLAVGLILVLITTSVQDRKFENFKIEAIQSGHAQYNPLTGTFEWLGSGVIEQQAQP